MAYKLLYIEDQAKESREQDLKNLGFEVDTFNPSSNLEEILQLIKADTSALILDYRLTQGTKNACFDAPTIAQTLRSKHSQNTLELPIILMSNEGVITEYYDDFTSRDLFDFSLTKKQFTDNQKKFYDKVLSFISAYNKIKECNFDAPTILGLQSDEQGMIHSRIIAKLTLAKENVFEHSSFIYENIIRAIGLLVGEEILAARLGVSKDSKDWNALLEKLSDAKYTGIFSDIHARWWWDKVNNWWFKVVGEDISLRRLDAEERVNILKEKLQLQDLLPATKSENSQSTNFWTICKVSQEPLDPFDGIEILKRDYLPWQEKEYLSFDSALINMETYSNYISETDKKALRVLAKKINSNE
jgi:hypothetical protein